MRMRWGFLLLHCKDFDSAQRMSSLFRWFGHASDPFVSISDGRIWLHDLTLTPLFNCIVPLITEKQVNEYPHRTMGGVCSDFIVAAKARFG